MVIDINTHAHAQSSLSDYIESCIHLNFARYSEVIKRAEVSILGNGANNEKKICRITMFLSYNSKMPLVIEEANTETKTAVRACVYHAKKALNRQLKLA